MPRTCFFCAFIMILDIAAALAAGRNTCYNKKTPPAMKDISRLRRLSKENAFQFYAAGVRCAAFEHPVPAPCFRHSFTLSAPEKACGRCAPPDSAPAKTFCWTSAFPRASRAAPGKRPAGRGGLYRVPLPEKRACGSCPSPSRSSCAGSPGRCREHSRTDLQPLFSGAIRQHRLVRSMNTPHRQMPR